MPTRRYFLDWLRVLAFGGLVLFHVGLMYSGWSYNLKSPVTYPAVEWLLEALSPWRMALLFVISGVACRFLIGKLGPGRFALDRLARLGPVILTGMLLVNPLQVWVQLLAQGDTAKGYLDFWLTSYLASDRAAIAALGRPMPTWDHLWFLVYLLPYTLLLAAGALLAPRDHAWAAIRSRRRTLLAAASGLLVAYLATRGAVLAQPDDLGWTLLYRSLQGAYGWTAVLAVTGFAARWLDSPSAALSYLNEAVLPVYVLHQPFMLAAAYLLFPLRLPLPLEAALLLAAAGLAPLAAYHLAIRPWRPVRRMFGLKPAAAGPQRAPAAA